MDIAYYMKGSEFELKTSHFFTFKIAISLTRVYKEDLTVQVVLRMNFNYNFKLEQSS